MHKSVFTSLDPYHVDDAMYVTSAVGSGVIGQAIIVAAPQATSNHFCAFSLLLAVSFTPNIQVNDCEYPDPSVYQFAHVSRHCLAAFNFRDVPRDK